MSELDDIVSDFLVESHENLDQLDRDLVELEVNPTDTAIASIFRTMHTIKGTCGFLGFTLLESVAHAAESLLSLVREKVIGVDAELTTALLSTVDAVRTMLAVIEATGSDGDGDYSALIAELERLQQRTEPAAEAAPRATDAAMFESAAVESDVVAAPVAAEPDAIAAPAPAKPTKKAAAKKAAKATCEEPEVEAVATAHLAEAPAAVPAAEPDVASSAIAQPVAPPTTQTPTEETVVAETPAPQPTTESASPVAPSADFMPATGAPLLTKSSESRSAAVDSSIRVDVDLLDTLMNLVGELVLARNQILQLTHGQQDSALAAPAQRLNLITTELQEGVMKTRMQPIGNVWSKFPRVVRDLSVSCGKHVRLEMDGAETELDKTIIEAIKDPLTHLVRNSIDHGIEAPEDRQRLGKPHEGKLVLRAFHEGGRVNIEISDDGKGIDADAVRAKAVERGVITADQASRMGHRELLNLIFLPGFSTAATISNVSGRGVGMDVVKTNIERIGGSVDVVTEIGVGTTFKISIPLTLAIIPALVVTSAGQRYAIPQISLLELVRLDASTQGHGIEYIHGAPVYRLRGRLLPIVDLAAELGGEADRDAANGVVNIVVLQADDRQFGLVVDLINDTQEIVVKPLGRLVKDVTTFAGATNMGDGRVALILDVMGLASRARVVSSGVERDLAEAAEVASSTAAMDQQSLLLLSVGDDRRLAIPLSAVARLEEFEASTMEMAGRNQVVQYRGEILPLVDLASVLGYGYGGTPAEGTVQVVVYVHHGRRVGIIVGDIVDIVSETMPPAGTSFVVQGRVTELVDPAMVAATVVGDDPDDAVIAAEFGDFDTSMLPDFAMSTSNGNGVHA